MLREEEEKQKQLENIRIKEWEDKFDREQQIKEDALIKKFYSDRTGQTNEELVDNSTVDIETNGSEENKNN